MKNVPNIRCQDPHAKAPMNDGGQLNQGRRRSERLKETTTLHTMEKVEKLAKKEFRR